MSHSHILTSFTPREAITDALLRAHIGLDRNDSLISARHLPEKMLSSNFIVVKIQSSTTSLPYTQNSSVMSDLWIPRI